MKYSGVPSMMWMLYRKSFRRGLSEVFKADAGTSKKITGKAKKDYKKIISGVPEFDKRDMYLTNIVNCAMLIAFIMNMEKRPTVEELTEYYDKVMRNKLTKLFCRMEGKKRFKEKTIRNYQKVSAYKLADQNEYSWNFDCSVYEDGSGYELRFTCCGICKLMKKYGYGDLIPAMCHLDYTMAELGGGCTFVRENTLASGGPCCDCGYKKN